MIVRVCISSVIVDVGLSKIATTVVLKHIHMLMLTSCSIGFSIVVVQLIRAGLVVVMVVPVVVLRTSSRHTCTRTRLGSVAGIGRSTSINSDRRTRRLPKHQKNLGP